MDEDQPTEETQEEKNETLPLDEKRPIFNSLIDPKESSRYLLDMMK